MSSLWTIATIVITGGINYGSLCKIVGKLDKNYS